MEFDINNLITEDKKKVEDEASTEKIAERAAKKKAAKKAPANKGGRPALPEADKKKNKVMSYYTDAEIELFKAVCEDTGLSLSNFVRRAALKALEEGK